MHKLLAVFMMLFLGMNALAEKSKPQLISFQKLMSLTSEKRIAYVSGVVKLLAMMEAQQLENEKNSDLAWDIRGMRDELIAMFDLLPQANALGGAGAQQAAEKKRKDEAAARAAKLLGNPIATQQSEQQEKSEPPKSNKIPDRLPVEESEPPPVVDSRCQPEEPLACTASKQAIATARKNIGKSGHRECIYGGQFSTYKGKVKAGGCQAPKPVEFKDENGRLKPTSCPVGSATAMCDPYVMCAKYADGKNVTAKNFPYKCMPVVWKGKADLTARCDNWYNGPGLAKSGLVKCDITEGPFDGLQEKWNEMRESFRTKYSNTCAVEADYKILFCEECQRMAKYAFELNQKATGSKCGDLADASSDPAEHEPGWHKGTN